jgi:hypothetical protein
MYPDGLLAVHHPYVFVRKEGEDVDREEEFDGAMLEKLPVNTVPVDLQI